VILLDTNVVSELCRPLPNPQVVAWFDGNRMSRYRISAMTIAEAAAGIEPLPFGVKRDALAGRVRGLLAVAFARAIMPIDETVAWDYGRVIAARAKAGRPVSTGDAMIAATARVHGLDLATRNAKDFEGLGLRLLDPWRA
jgi:predicted nucleic acid-binding protein